MLLLWNFSNGTGWEILHSTWKWREQGTAPDTKINIIEFKFPLCIFLLCDQVFQEIFNETIEGPTISGSLFLILAQRLIADWILAEFEHVDWSNAEFRLNETMDVSKII